MRDHLPSLDGEVELTGTLVGSIEKPKVEVRALGHGVAIAGRRPPPLVGKGGEVVVRPAPESPWGLPVDLDVALTLRLRSPALRQRAGV